MNSAGSQRFVWALSLTGLLLLAAVVSVAAQQRQQPALVVQAGHSSPVNAVSFSRVPEMQFDKMKMAHASGRDLSFADDERGLSLARRSGQRPRVFYRREPESKPLLIARP
jgi:hypothetical protein